MKGKQIEHWAVVERVLSHAVVVSVVQETACAACAAAALCHSSEKQEKRMEIPCANPSIYSEGQKVYIVGDIRLGLHATVWAYVVPLMLLVGTLMLATRLLGSEALGALCSLGVLIPYYIILYMLRGRLQRRFTFQIRV